MNFVTSSAALAKAAPDQKAIVHADYRPDIDGLRAIAVLAVVLEHIHATGFSGGFIGVDVFFVISGFLIFRNLDTAIRSGTFSFWNFYGRRLRRTLPALYLVAAACLIVGLFLLLPGDLDALGQALISVLLFVPNIVLSTQTAYFDPGAYSKPLLHTWSLGVEEQFYLLAPLLPLALRLLRPRARKITLIILFAAGLAICAVWQQVAPQAAFYLMPARFWEFLAGCLVAEGAFPQIRSPRAAEIAAGVALLVLLVSIMAFSAHTPHPGLLTALPCLATAALIHTGGMRQTAAGRLLGNGVLVGIGLMSYSIYLWHWPLIVFLRYADLRLTPFLILVAAALLFGASYLSWRYVEIPFRTPGSSLRKNAAVILPITALVLLAASLVFNFGRGLPLRFPAAIDAVAHYYYYREYRPFREGQCFITSRNSLAEFQPSICLKLDPERHNILLLGDSHAAHLWTGLRDTWPDSNFLQATASGCKPLLGATGDGRCTALMADVLQHFIPAHRLDGIVVSAYWEKGDIPALKATIAYLKRFTGHITIFGPSVLYDASLSTLLANALRHGDIASVQSHQRRRIPPLDSKMEKAIAPLATYVSTYQAMCPKHECQLFAAPSVPMQFDDQHLTPQGADLLMKDILAQQSLRF